MKKPQLPLSFRIAQTQAQIATATWELELARKVLAANDKDRPAEPEIYHIGKFTLVDAGTYLYEAQKRLTEQAEAKLARLQRKLAKLQGEEMK